MPSAVSPEPGFLERRLSVYGPPTSERRRGFYVVAGALCTAAALLILSVADLVAGRSAQALQSFLVASLFVLISIQFRRRVRPEILARLTLTLAMVVIVEETYIGANGGFTFLWFYALPIGCFYALGRREGLLWFLAGLGTLAWLVFVVDPKQTEAGSVGAAAVATFALLGLLAYGLESARFRLSRLLEREKAELEQALADLETLYDLVPICASCKSVRDDKGYWRDIETYLSQHPAVEMQSAFCPDCQGTVGSRIDGSGLGATPSEIVSGSVVQAVRRGQEHLRRRQSYFAAGMALLIPLMIYFGALDLRAGRYLEGGMIYALVSVYIGALVFLRRFPGRADRKAFEATVLAVFPVIVHHLYLGAYDGYAVLWLYSFPAFTVFLLGTRGLFWSSAAFVLSTGLLLLPFGFTYPAALVGRFLITFALVTAMAFALESARKRSEQQLLRESETLRKTLEEVASLQGLLPICPSCKNVRDDQGFWEQIETHMERQAGTRFTHGLCPDCLEEALTEVDAL